MKKNILCLIAASIFIAGCATTQRMDSADRTNLSAVRINKAVEKPPQMNYLSQGGAFGFALGAVGGLITGTVQIPLGEQFKNFAEGQGIFIEQIVLEETMDALRRSGKVSLTEAEGPNTYVLNIAITQYGFSVPTAFSSKLVPLVGIRCSLVDSTGKTIWASNDRTHPLGNPVEARSLEELRSDPNLIQDSWRLATKTVVANIVGNL